MVALQSRMMPWVSCVVLPDLPTFMPTWQFTGTLDTLKYTGEPPERYMRNGYRTRPDQHQPVAQSTKLTPPVKLIGTKRSRIAMRSAGLLPPSNGPGCRMLAPSGPALLLAKTWLLLSART